MMRRKRGKRMTMKMKMKMKMKMEKAMKASKHRPTKARMMTLIRRLSCDWLWSTPHLLWPWRRVIISD